MPIPPYTIEPSNRFRTMTLVVHPDGSIRVRVPADYDNAAVRRFVDHNTGWIEKQRQHFQVPARPAVHTLIIGDREVPCTIIYQGTRKKMTVRVYLDGWVEARVPEDTGLESVIAFLEQKRDWIRQAIDGGRKDQEPAGEPQSVTWNGKVIPYSLRISRRARRLSIKVHSDRSVEVVAPVAATGAEIERLVREKAEWVYTTVMSDARPVAVRRSFCDGEVYPLLGGTLTVQVTRGRPTITVVREGDFLKIGLPEGMSGALEQKAIRRAVEYTLKDETRKVVVPLVTHYAARFGVAVPLIEVRDARHKWGSCVGRKKLLFSTRLCMLPPRLVHYVVAHEVCHIVVMDHSNRFWEALQVIMPDCRERATDLRRDSPLYLLLPA